MDKRRSRKLDLDTPKRRDKTIVGEDSEREALTRTALIKEIAKVMEVDPRDILGPRRTKPIAFARMLSYFLWRHYFQISYQEIGNDFGHKHHTTILNGIKRVLYFGEDENKVLEGRYLRSKRDLIIEKVDAAYEIPFPDCA